MKNNMVYTMLTMLQLGLKGSQSYHFNIWKCEFILPYLS